MLTEVAFLTCRRERERERERERKREREREREFQMAAPEYMNDLRKSSQLSFDVYSWLELVDLLSRHDTSEVHETRKTVCWFF